MINFNWIFQEIEPTKLRTFLFSKGVTQTLLKNIRYHGGHLIVNRQEVVSSYILTYGDKVQIILPEEPQNEALKVSELPINILFENDNFLVVDKPVGVPTVTSRIYKNDTLANQVLGYYIKNNYPSKTVHVVNRLDRDTSGPVIFAKNAFGHAVLDKQLQNHEIKKYYVAIVQGQVEKDHGEIDLPIGRKDGSFVERTIRSDGKKALTEYWVLKRGENLTEVKIRLHTGRTHQIRVHFKSIGNPLIGDWLYNPDNHQSEYQMLHCYETEFWDPFANKTIKVSSEIPEEFNHLIEKDY